MVCFPWLEYQCLILFGVPPTSLKERTSSGMAHAPRCRANFGKGTLRFSVDWRALRARSAIAGYRPWPRWTAPGHAGRGLTTLLSSRGHRRRQGTAPETDHLLPTLCHHGRRLTLRFRGNPTAGRAGYSVGATQPHAQQRALLGPGISHLHFSLPTNTVNSRSTHLRELLPPRHVA